MKTLIVRSGGGLPGIDVHIGYWKALEEAGIHGDVLHGTSAGSIISALDAIGWTAKEAELNVSLLSDNDIRDERLFWKLRPFSVPSIMKGEKKIKLLTKFLTDRRSTRASSLHVWAMRLPDASLRNALMYGDLISSVAASCAIPVVFPRVRLHDGHEYVDGGISANIPLPNDWNMYDRVIVLDATLDDPTSFSSRNDLVSNAVGAARLSMRSQATRVRETVSISSNSLYISMPGVKDKGVLHFDHSLIDRAYVAAQKAIKEKGWAKI